MRKTTPIELSGADPTRLQKFIGSGTALARQIKHAHVLLKLANGWQNTQVAQAFDLTEKTVIAIRKRFLTEGLEAALKDKPRRGAPPKIDSDVKALLIATACSAAPDGQTRWTLRMLAERMVELEVVENISHESVRGILKKRNKALAKTAMVHSEGRSRICKRDGECPGYLPFGLQSGSSGSMPGRKSLLLALYA